MPKKTLSLVELEKLVDERHLQIETLFRKREQLEKNVQRIDDEIQVFLNPESARRRPLKGRRRPKNEVPLRIVIHQILAENKKGLSLSDLTSKVKAGGYQSFSQNLKNVVYQSVYKSKEIVLDKQTGQYRLSK